ncbi:DMT family transporter [Acidocella sp. MX-AZ03]|uniref:DMT family transporter n=1 Tax=Acidocella sp. MX-AZ03 TaxID=2697363 RepID=UPI002FD7FA10
MNCTYPYLAPPEAFRPYRLFSGRSDDEQDDGRLCLGRAGDDLFQRLDARHPRRPGRVRPGISHSGSRRAGRAAGPGGLAGAAPEPAGAGDLLSLAIVAFGVVLGFPLLTALALRHIDAAQSQIFLGLLPLSTALFGVLRGGERPRSGFWIFALLGSACVVLVALRHKAQLPPAGVGLMLAAILVCGLGYAEGAKLARRLGGWQVISWALVLALPWMLALGWLNAPPASLACPRAPGWGWAMSPCSAC